MRVHSRIVPGTSVLPRVLHPCFWLTMYPLVVNLGICEKACVCLHRYCYVSVWAPLVNVCAIPCTLDSQAIGDDAARQGADQADSRPGPVRARCARQGYILAPVHVAGQADQRKHHGLWRQRGNRGPHMWLFACLYWRTVNPGGRLLELVGLSPFISLCPMHRCIYVCVCVSQ